jgi:hypothetical protein
MELSHYDRSKCNQMAYTRLFYLERKSQATKRIWNEQPTRGAGGKKRSQHQAILCCCSIVSPCTRGAIFKHSSMPLQCPTQGRVAVASRKSTNMVYKRGRTGPWEQKQVVHNVTSRQQKPCYRAPESTITGLETPSYCSQQSK